MPRLTLLVAFCAAALVGVLPAGDSSAADKVDFIRDIRPILSNTCFKCHGFDDKTRQANLRLDLADGAMAKTDSGAAAIVPGKSGESEIVRRLTATDAGERMPPAGSGKSVTPEQIELIKRWIDEGAEFKPHWSFVAPVRPPVPMVKNDDAIRNPIDNFVLARLEKDGLAPSPPADKVTLIRRVTLDLTGLPPTVAEVEEFLADESPEAYAKVVDRLLKSPRYGEHMARYWLDAARYGDTHGLHFDNERSLWPYRDWVIGAFNENKPFDQFTIEQLAGDLLPNATVEQKIATGFTRCNVSTSEGGSIDEEVLVRYGVDRVETTSTVFLGLTLGCAVCHNHKFDPVTQKEFYQLFAFFNGISEAAMDGNQIAPPPIMKLPTPQIAAKQQELDVQIAKVSQTIAEELAKVSYTDPNPYAKAAEATEYVWIDDAAPAGAQLQGDSEWKFVTKAEGPVFSGEKASTRKAAGLSQHFFTGASPGLAIGEGDKLFGYVYLDPADLPKTIMLQFNDGSWEHRCFWGEDVIAWGAPNTPAHVAMGPLPKAGEWVRLEVDAAKVGLNPGASLNGWAFTQHAGTVYWDKAGIVTKTPQAGQSFESLAQWEAVEKSLSKPTAPPTVVEAIKVDADKRNDAQKKLIRDHFLENVYAKTKATFDPLHKQRDELAKQRTDLENSIPTTMVTAEMDKPRETFLLIRGQYDKKGDKVEPGVPAILPPLPAGAPANRLGFAKWLVDPNHPLTARVTVNRFWQQYYGVGIVKTAEDFGSQGELPSHPELLDWLSREFVESGWNVKELQRLIVMSATYRQASHVIPELAERDPENRLLARGPRFRLDGEVIRDSALFMAGLLVERPGGRGVRPYQPDGIWEAVAFLGSNTQNYKRDEGDALYRRSLYTFWKRTAPPPAFMTFDAPSREACVVRRARTNTPLQALLLMNDTQYVEAARNLAQKMMTSGGTSPEQRLSYGFRLATARQPSPEETAVLARVLQTHLADYQADKAAGEKLVSIGVSPRNALLDVSELAAYTMVANLILNLDETVTKE